jgi:hypothetical protein
MPRETIGPRPFDRALVSGTSVAFPRSIQRTRATIEEARQARNNPAGKRCCAALTTGAGLHNAKAEKKFIFFRGRLVDTPVASVVVATVLRARHAMT